jgi:endonuclease-8
VPEGHTIHRAALDQAPGLVGWEVTATSPNHLFQSGAAQLDGRRVERVEAWGKHLFYLFSGSRVLHVHLGMDGRFGGRGLPLVRLAGSRLTVDITRPKICAVIDPIHMDRIVSRLGPDPIRTDDHGGSIWPRLQTHDGPLGMALLDQTLVAGIGNVYRAEILFANRIHPERPAATVTELEWQAIWDTAVRMLRAGVEDRGRIITVDRRDMKVRDRRRTYVYGQRFCAHCGSPIRQWDLAGRVAYACETCQPRGAD